MFKKLRTVIYHVSDLAAARDWYREATGIEPYFDEPFYVGFDIHGFELGLDPDIGDLATGNHSVSYWAVGDTEEVSEKLISLGAKLIQPRTNVGGEIYTAIVEDPFGNQLGLIDGA